MCHKKTILTKNEWQQLLNENKMKKNEKNGTRFCFPVSQWGKLMPAWKKNEKKWKKIKKNILVCHNCFCHILEHF